MNRHIIYNYSQALTERLSGYSLIPRVEDLCNIEEVHLYFCFLNHELVLNSIKCFPASIDMCLFF